MHIKIFPAAVRSSPTGGGFYDFSKSPTKEYKRLYCTDFSKRYDLPHINPHAFRHTMVSVLYFNGVDSISISRRLGHSKVSTTTDKYGHIMRKADEAAANCIADVIFDEPREKQSKIS